MYVGPRTNAEKHFRYKGKLMNIHVIVGGGKGGMMTCTYDHVTRIAVSCGKNKRRLHPLFTTLYQQYVSVHCINYYYVHELFPNMMESVIDCQREQSTIHEHDNTSTWNLYTQCPFPTRPPIFKCILNVLIRFL